MTALLVSAALLACACASGRTGTASVLAGQQDGELDRIARAVEQALPAGVRLLSVQRRGESIVLDLSDELLAGGRGGELEDALHRVMLAASGARTPPRPRVEDYRILVNGVPLEQRIP